MLAKNFLMSHFRIQQVLVLFSLAARAEKAKSVDCHVRSLFQAAGTGIGDESLVKKRIQPAIDGVMQEPVADAGLVDIPGLGVGNIERLIAAVFVGMME